jgi:hypothetical protein
MKNIVLLISPKQMAQHPNGPIFKALFEKSDLTLNEVTAYLKEKDLDYRLDIGNNEFGEQMFAFEFNGVFVFGLKF